MGHGIDSKVIRITYYGPLKSVVGTSEDLLLRDTLREPTMLNILQFLGRMHGPKFTDLIFHDDGVNLGVNVFVNGKCLTQKKEFEEKLAYDSEIEIVLVSQASGG